MWRTAVAAKVKPAAIEHNDVRCRHGPVKNRATVDCEIVECAGNINGEIQIEVNPLVKVKFKVFDFLAAWFVVVFAINDST